MDSPVKFSILVPVYRVEKFIRECIESVLNQTYPRFELILVDDGSPDKSGEICDEYAAKDPRIRVFHKANGGAFQTRCFALEKAEGDYILFLDSDDYLAPKALEVLNANIIAHGADCIIYGIEWLRPGGAVAVACSGEYCGRLITDKRDALTLILNDASYNSLCRKCVRAGCFSGRDFSPYYHIKSGEDRIHSEEILENARSFLFLPELLYFYRANTESVTHSISYDGYRADFTVEESCLSMLERLGVFSPADFDRLRNSFLDALVIELKRLSRFCSSGAESVRGMKSIRENEHYKAFLDQGYSKVPPIAGVPECAGLRRLLNRVAIALLHQGCYRLLIFFNKYIYR